MGASLRACGASLGGIHSSAGCLLRTDIHLPLLLPPSPLPVHCHTITASAAMSIARSAALLRPTAAHSAKAVGRRAVASRGFATASAENIPIAASADEGSKTTVVTVALRAGPRFESTPGVAHVLKNFTFKSNAKRSALALIREAELYGGVLSSALTKEHLLLTAEFLRGDE